MDTKTLTWLLPVFPVLAFFLIVLFFNRSKLLSTILAVGAAGLSLIGAIVVIARSIRIENVIEHPIEQSIPWFPITGEIAQSGVLIKWLNVGILIDPLTVITLAFASITMFMIFFYSIG
jgi:NADH-quinone oxidoreductase subunit L